MREKENERQMLLEQQKLISDREANDISMKAMNAATFGNKIAMAALFFALLSFLKFALN